MAEATPKHGNRKRKRTFLQKQTRFFKKGRYANGTHLPDDVYQYFLQILPLMNVKKGDSEDQLDICMLAENVFNETEGKEVEYSRNQIASRVIEELLPHSSDMVLKKYTDSFSADPRPMLSDAFSSHIYETLLRVCTERVLKNYKPSEADKKEEPDMNRIFVVNTSKYLLNNLEEFVWDKYGSHVIQTNFDCLSGNPVKNETNPVKYEVPDEFHALLKEYSKRLLSWPQFADLPDTDLTSSLVQCLLRGNKKNSKTLKKLVKKLINENFAKTINDSEELKVWTNPASVRVLEECVMLAPPKYRQSIFELCFKGRIKHLSLIQTSNYAVQKLIKSTIDKPMFEEIFQELEGSFEDILKVNHTGVLLALAEICCSLVCKQGDFIKELSKALKCFEPVERNLEIVPAVCTLTAVDAITDDTKIKIHGSLIVQELLKFNKPIKIVNSILNIKTEKLVRLISDPRGSHVVNAFVDSQYVGEKSREKLAKKLQGHFVELSKSKHGSRSVDAIFDCSNIKQKTFIMEELKIKQSDLVSTPFGNGVSKRLHLDQYRHNKEKWIQLYSQASSKQDLFADLFTKKVKGEKSK